MSWPPEATVSSTRPEAWQQVTGRHALRPPLFTTLMTSGITLAVCLMHFLAVFDFLSFSDAGPIPILFSASAVYPSYLQPIGMPMSNHLPFDINVRTRGSTRQVRAKDLSFPQAYFYIDEHSLRGVIQAGEAILAHDFSADRYSGTTQHAPLGNGIVASFTRLNSGPANTIVINFPGISLHYSIDQFREAMDSLKAKEADLRAQRAANAQPVMEIGGCSVEEAGCLTIDKA